MPRVARAPAALAGAAGGPHHLRRGKGRGRGAGRVLLWAAPPPGQQSPHADCTYADDSPGHDDEHVDQLAHCGEDGLGDLGRKRGADEDEHGRAEAAAAAAVGMCAVRKTCGSRSFRDASS